MGLKKIAARIGVSVSSVHAWTRDIELTPEQRQQHLLGPRGPANPEAVAARAAACAATARTKRMRFQEEGRLRARLGEPLHQAGCMLYWAEGTKGRNSARLVNSDPHMVRFFVCFTRTCFDVAPHRFRVSLNVYLNNGLSIEEIERHWLGLLDLPRSCLRKHALDCKPTSSSGRRRHRLPYGVCSVYVHSTRIVQHIFGAIQEYGGFEEPRWLD